jgi:hypothetical protein
MNDHEGWIATNPRQLVAIWEKDHWITRVRARQCRVSLTPISEACIPQPLIDYKLFAVVNRSGDAIGFYALYNHGKFAFEDL